MIFVRPPRLSAEEIVEELLATGAVWDTQADLELPAPALGNVPTEHSSIATDGAVQFTPSAAATGAPNATASSVLGMLAEGSGGGTADGSQLTPVDVADGWAAPEVEPELGHPTHDDSDDNAAPPLMPPPPVPADHVLHRQPLQPLPAAIDPDVLGRSASVGTNTVMAGAAAGTGDLLACLPWKPCWEPERSLSFSYPLEEGFTPSVWADCGANAALRDPASDEGRAAWASGAGPDIMATELNAWFWHPPAQTSTGDAAASFLLPRRAHAINLALAPLRVATTDLRIALLAARPNLPRDFQWATLWPLLPGAHGPGAGRGWTAVAATAELGSVRAMMEAATTHTARTHDRSYGPYVPPPYWDYQQSPLLEAHGKAERFVYAVATVPAHRERVALRMLQQSNERATEVAALSRAISATRTACEELRAATPVMRRLLSMILQLGNYLNGGDALIGGAQGFALADCLQLQQVESADGGATSGVRNLLGFVVQMTQQQRQGQEEGGEEADVLNWPATLPNVGHCSLLCGGRNSGVHLFTLWLLCVLFRLCVVA